MTTHEHEWERGVHMRTAFGVDGRRYACAICGLLREFPTQERERLGRQHRDGMAFDARCSVCNPEPESQR